MFKEPIRLTVVRDAHWTVSSPDIPVCGAGATPREAMDALASAVVNVAGLFRSSDMDDAEAAFSRFLDQGRPCPDSEARRCGDRIRTAL